MKTFATACMRKGVGVILIGLLGLYSVSGFAGEVEVDPYFLLQKPVIEEITVPGQSNIRSGGIHTFAAPDSGLTPSSFLDSLKEMPIQLDRIINMGERVWKIIEGGRPVSNVQTASANAVPEGVKDWTSLESWKAPISKVFRVSYRNFYGRETVVFNYRLIYTYGGTVSGKGAYLTNVTIVPADVFVAWGHRLSAEVKIANVTNAGTVESPVAAIELLVGWKIDNAFKHVEESASYYLKGDGSFIDLSAGTEGQN